VDALSTISTSTFFGSLFFFCSFLFEEAAWEVKGTSRRDRKQIKIKNGFMGKIIAFRGQAFKGGVRGEAENKIPKGECQ